MKFDGVELWFPGVQLQAITAVRIVLFRAFYSILKRLALERSYLLIKGEENKHSSVGPQSFFLHLLLWPFLLFLYPPFARWNPSLCISSLERLDPPCTGLV
jgi:hypothetical protein